MTQNEPSPQRAGPTVERVPARTRAPLLAIAIVVVTLGVLIAKPWEETPSPAESSKQAPTAPEGDQAAATPPAPTPASPEAASGVYTVEIGSTGDVARCLYDRTRKGEWRLGALLILPPRAYLTGVPPQGRTINVGWRVELQANHQESLFNAAWTPVAESRLQVVSAADDSPASFMPMEVQVDTTMGRTAVVRARLLVDWHSESQAEIASAEMIMPTYIVGGRASGPLRQSCPAIALEPF